MYIFAVCNCNGNGNGFRNFVSLVIGRMEMSNTQWLDKLNNKW